MAQRKIMINNVDVSNVVVKGKLHTKNKTYKFHINFQTPQNLLFFHRIDLLCMRPLRFKIGYINIISATYGSIEKPLLIHYYDDDDYDYDYNDDDEYDDNDNDDNDNDDDNDHDDDDDHDHDDDDDDDDDHNHDDHDDNDHDNDHDHILSLISLISDNIEMCHVELEHIECLHVCTIDCDDDCKNKYSGRKVCGCGCDKLHDGGGGYCNPWPENCTHITL